VTNDPSQIQPGDRLPPWTAPSGIEAWNRFAAVNDEFVPVHMDDEAGRRAGNDGGAFGMGNLRLSYVANLLRDWAGDTGDIRELHLEYRSRHQKHDVLTATGTVAAVSLVGDERHVTVAVDVIAQDGRSTAPGTALVAFPVVPAERPAP
jgi:hypothetical protein